MTRSSLWYSLSALAGRALGFVLVPVFAVLLSPEQLGVAALATTWAGVFTVGFSLYLYAVPPRARTDFDDITYDDFVSCITSLSIISSTLLTAVLWLLPQAVFGIVFGLPKVLVLAAAISVPFFMPLRMILSRWEGEGQARRVALVGLVLDVLTAVLSLVLIIIPTWFDPNYDRALGRIAGVLVARVLLGLYYARYTLTKRFFQTASWHYALVYALPIVPHALAGEVLANYDRVIIAQFYSSRETGIYSVVYQFGTVIAIVAAASASAWMPWYYRRMAEGDFDEVRKRSNQYILAFTTLTCGALIIWPAVVRLVLPPAYYEGVSIIPIVMAGGYFIFIHYFFIFFESQEKKTGYASVATLITTGFNIGLNYLIIPQAGYLSAGWTTLASYIVLFLVHAAVVRLWMKNDVVNDLRLMVTLGVFVVALATIVAYFLSNIT